MDRRLNLSTLHPHTMVIAENPDTRAWGRYKVKDIPEGYIAVVLSDGSTAEQKYLGMMPTHEEEE